MIRPLPRLLLTVALIALFAWLLGRAIDVEHAQAHNVGVRAAVCKVFGSRCAAALRVVACETGGTFNPRAVGRAGERGIFQLHPVHRGWIDRLYGWHRMFDPLANSRAAYRLSRGGTNWRPWAWRCRP